MSVAFRELRVAGIWIIFLATAWSSIFTAKAVELRFFPVVKNTEITEVVELEDGLNVYLTFDKVRTCEFVKLAWYGAAGEILDVTFNDDRGTRPPSRNEVGPWFVETDSLEGTELYVQHTCHPAWFQWTKMYP